MTASDWWFRSKAFDFPDEHRLRMPDGTRLPDAAIWPDFAREELGLDVDEVWRDLVRLPVAGDHEKLVLDRDGSRPRWIRGTHPALRMRGHPLRRSKLWLQRHADFRRRVVRRYGYTGWQWRVLGATSAVEAMPVSGQELVDRLDEGYARKSGGVRPNHWIFTRYATGADNIGFHSDKVRDIDFESWFVVIKLGAPRPFALRTAEDRRIVFHEELPAGTAVFVRCRAHDGSDANHLLQHAVPAVAVAGDSGSLVARVIRTTTTFAEMDAQLAKLARERRRRVLGR